MGDLAGDEGCHHLRMARHAVIDKNQIGPFARGYFAAVVEPHGPCGIARYQLPGIGKLENAAARQSEDSRKLRWIVVVGGENAAEAGSDQVVAQMPPRWLPPRKALGAPMTIWLPKPLAVSAALIDFGNSEMLQPRAA